jgi:hypothetical protein
MDIHIIASNIKIISMKLKLQVLNSRALNQLTQDEEMDRILEFHTEYGDVDVQIFSKIYETNIFVHCHSVKDKTIFCHFITRTDNKSFVHLHLENIFLTIH